MSMRISVLEPVQQTKKRSASLNHLNLVGLTRPFDFFIRAKPTEVYVRNRQIPLRSPFRKYERCITENIVATSPPKPLPRTVKTVSTLTYNNNTPTTTTTTTTTTNTILLGRKFPIDAGTSASLAKGLSGSNSNLKLVNSFEDLVIRCVDPAYRNDRDVVCYKKRYLVNMGGSHLNLNDLDKDNYRPSFLRQRSPTTAQAQPNSVRKRSVSSEDPQRNRAAAGETAIAAVTSSFSGGAEVRTCQPPLGTPDIYQTVIGGICSSSRAAPPLVATEKRVRFDFDDDSLVNIELNPDTAEQFIDLLILEDSALRRKIAEGDMDPKTLAKLDRLTELRHKYLKYREERTRLRQEQLQLQMQLNANSGGAKSPAAVVHSLPAATQVDITLNDNLKPYDHSSQNERDTIFIESVQRRATAAAPHHLPLHSAAGDVVSATTTKSIPVFHSEKVIETTNVVSNNSPTSSSSSSCNSSGSSSSSSSSSSANCSNYRRSVKVGSRPSSSRTSRRCAAAAATHPHTTAHLHSSSTFSNSNARHTHLHVSSSSSGSSRRISSLRDSAFSHELKFHPLIKENSYLRSKLD
jgi:hypothetical protein